MIDREKDIQMVCKAMVEDYQYYDYDIADRVICVFCGKEEFENTFGSKEERILGFVHDKDCPVLIAKDLITRGGVLEAQSESEISFERMLIDKYYTYVKKFHKEDFDEFQNQNEQDYKEKKMAKHFRKNLDKLNKASKKTEIIYEFIEMIMKEEI